MAKAKGFGELREYLENHPAAKTGGLVDTSILFSASYPLDRFNEDAEKVFDLLAELSVPIYTTSNIRAEFVDLHRRVLIPECLIGLLEDAESDLEASLVLKLKSLRTRYRKAHDEDKSFKLSDQEIKTFRESLSQFTDGECDGWELFCKYYLTDKIEPIWAQVVDEFGLNFIGLRSQEPHPLLTGDVSFDGATRLVAKFGVGTVDAMILNLFFNSKLPFLLTADRDIAYCIEKEDQAERVVFLPDELL